ncbi:precorrin-2 C(20)-methyltransferase [Aureimonas frigidaquae]|uniref:precorrin-2 C(20)-methyltransferase n=1 Tax=Aureimonas frigidaquae TaxID=424757 RepID=UPI00078413AE|nr:precorrin-2 C(20)-methyltransferase [Aureimonas frigidaquae]
MTGRLIGIGLGPGDPELLTLKAVRLLRAAPVIAYPVPDSGVSRARAIAAPHLGGQQAEIPIDLCMRVDPAPGQAAYDRAAVDIARRLDQGEDVALLCEGDPLFYGSFLYLSERLAPRFAVEIVPGVASPMAGAAALRLPLARRNDTFCVLPATLDTPALTQRLALADAFCIIKLGRHFARVRALLDTLGLTPHCHYLAHLTQEGQELSPLATARAEAPYFSMILGHRKAAA